MDYRTQKTKRSIYNAFLALRARTPLEKMTVKKLCETAQINKSTFYVYYHDVYDLSDQIENEIISEVIQNLAQSEAVLTDTVNFTKCLFLAYTAQNALIQTIFSDSRASQLPLKIEAALKETMNLHYPQYKDDMEFHIRLTYCIYGSFYAYNQYDGCNEEQVVTLISVISEKVMRFPTP